MIEEIVKGCRLNRFQKAKLEKILKEYEYRFIGSGDKVWIEHLENFINAKNLEGKSAKTTERYKMEIMLLMNTINIRVEDVTSDDVFKYLADYKEKKKVSNVTLENKRLVYSSFYAWLCIKGIISNNPILSLGNFKIEKKIKKPFTDEERHKLINACKTKKERALLEVLYTSCARVGEIEKIKLEDINFPKKEMVVFGKGSKERIVYLSDVSMLYINDYLQSRKQESVYLFTNERNADPLCKENIRRILRNLSTRAKVENVHPHRFRRTGATNALRRGMPIQEVSIMLGHEKIETTMIYCDIDQQSVKYNHSKYLSY